MNPQPAHGAPQRYHDDAAVAVAAKRGATITGTKKRLISYLCDDDDDDNDNDNDGVNQLNPPYKRHMHTSQEQPAASYVTVQSSNFTLAAAAKAGTGTGTSGLSSSNVGSVKVRAGVGNSCSKTWRDQSLKERLFGPDSDNDTEEPIGSPYPQRKHGDLSTTAVQTTTVHPVNSLHNATSTAVNSATSTDDYNGPNESCPSKSVLSKHVRPPTNVPSPVVTGTTTKPQLKESSPVVTVPSKMYPISPQQSADLAEVRPNFRGPFKQPDCALALPVPLHLLPAANSSTGVSNQVLPTMVPQYVARYLIDHQVDGIKWLWQHFVDKSGCILGDDMGMGKTVQVIGLLLAIYQKTGVVSEDRKQLHARKYNPHAFLQANPTLKGPSLIVMPNSVLTNWERELHTWGTFAHKSVSSGNTEAHVGILDQLKEHKIEVLLIPYPQLGKYVEELSAVRWKVIVFDEGHTVKNDKSKLFETCQSLTYARCKVILSGTPIQNKLTELWSALTLISPRQGWMSKEDFKDYYDKPITLSNSSRASEEAVEIGQARAKELNAYLSERYLARKKESLQGESQLKGKDDILILCDPSPLQEELYQAVLALPDFDNLKRHSEQCPCALGKRFGTTRGHCCIQYRVPYIRIPDNDADTTGELAGEGAQGDRPDETHLSSAQQKPMKCIQYRTVDPRAVIWRQMHLNDQPCPRCPTCVSLPCIFKLLQIACNAALLQVESYDDLQCGAGAGGARKSARNENRDEEEEYDEAFEVYGEFAGRHLMRNRDKLLQFLKEAVSEDLLHRIPGGYNRQSNFTEQVHSADQLSGKMKVLKQLLEQFIAAGQKTLIFSYSTKVLDLIEVVIKGKGWLNVRLDGSTPQDKRQKLVDEFNQDEGCTIPVFLLSSKAGGLGLNLTSATKVVLFDIHWNPSVDNQSQDRAYRLGQMQKVAVYHLVTRGTVEEIVYMRQLYKQQLSAVILEPAAAAAAAAAATGGGPTATPATGQLITSLPQRNFEGVQGRSDLHGELFGCNNILQYNEGSILNTVRKKYNDNVARTQTPGSRGLRRVAWDELPVSHLRDNAKEILAMIGIDPEGVQPHSIDLGTEVSTNITIAAQDCNKDIRNSKHLSSKRATASKVVADPYEVETVSSLLGCNSAGRRSNHVSSSSPPSLAASDVITIEDDERMVLNKPRLAVTDHSDHTRSTMAAETDDDEKEELIGASSSCDRSDAVVSKYIGLPIRASAEQRNKQPTVIRANLKKTAALPTKPFTLYRPEYLDDKDA